VTFSAAARFRRHGSRRMTDETSATHAADQVRDERTSSQAIHETSVQMLNRMADALEARNARVRAGLSGGLPGIKPR
jgi:hypothetical protein